MVTPVLGGVKIRGSRFALGDQWQNLVAQGFLVIGHLPSRAVSVGACHKSPLRQRHFSFRKHPCLHHPSLRQSGTTLVRRRNWKMLLVHAGWCRRPGRGRNTGLPCFCCAMMVCSRRPGRDKNTRLPIRWCCFFWCKAAAVFVPKLPPQLNIACLCVHLLGGFTPNGSGAGDATVRFLHSDGITAVCTGFGGLIAGGTVLGDDTGRTHFSTGGTGLDDVTGWMHLPTHGNFDGFLIEGLCRLGGICEMSSLLFVAGEFGCATWSSLALPWFARPLVAAVCCVSVSVLASVYIS